LPTYALALHDALPISTRAPRDAESVLPSQRRPERAPLRQGVELLDEVLYAVPRGLHRQRAAAVAIEIIGVIKVNATIVRGPGRLLRPHTARSVRLPARRAGAAPLRANQQHAACGARSIHRGTGRTYHLHRFDILDTQVG